MAEKLKVIVEVDGKQARATLGNINKSAQKTKKGFLDLGSVTKNLIGAFLGFQAIKASIGFMANAAKAASDLEEALSKQAVVFRGLEKDVERFNQTLQTEFGLSRTAAAQFTSLIQDTLVPLGLARDEAAGLSFEVTKLAVDIGSFNNLPTEQVLTSIQSALVGNVETVRKFGISINQATIEQRAMADGLIKSKDEMNAQVKALTILKLIQEGSTDAIGDFARTSEGFANQMKILSSRFVDFQAALGTFVINSPIIVGAIKTITSELETLSNFLDKDQAKIKARAKAQQIIFETLKKDIVAIDEDLKQLNLDIAVSLNLGEDPVGLEKRRDVLLAERAIIKDNIKIQKEELGIVETTNKVKEIQATKTDDQLKKEKAAREALIEFRTKQEGEAVARLQDKIIAIQEKGAAKEKENREKQKEDIKAFNESVIAQNQQLVDLQFQSGEITQQQFLENLEARKQLLQDQQAADLEGTRNFALEVAQVEKQITDIKASEAQKRLALEQSVVSGTGGLLKDLAALNKNASRENFAVFQAVAVSEGFAQTALNIIKALGQPPFPGTNIFAAGLAGAKGLLQVGVIAAQKPSFQTETGESRIVPGPRNVGVPAIVHGGEVIGRGQAGGMTVNIIGDFLQTDETAQRLTEIIFANNKNVGSPPEFISR